jgi:hypothetical protein
MKGEKISRPSQNASSRSWFAHNSDAAARKPSVDAPVSPMNIRAGGKFQTRKPRAEAAIAPLTSANGAFPCAAPTIARVPKPMAAMPPANPSMPSMKL